MLVVVLLHLLLALLRFLADLLLQRLMLIFEQTLLCEKREEAQNLLLSLLLDLVMILLPPRHLDKALELLSVRMLVALYWGFLDHTLEDWAEEPCLE